MEPVRIQCRSVCQTALMACVVALIVLAAAGCGSSGTGDSSTTAGSGSATTSVAKNTPTTATTTVESTTTATTTDKADTATDYGNSPRNLRIGTAEKAALLRTANAYKAAHESEYGVMPGTFKGVAMTGPQPGSTYYAGWGRHEYALAGFRLKGWELENQYLLARSSAPGSDWRVLRVDFATDVGGVCTLPHRLLAVWRADMMGYCTPAPMRGSRVDAGLTAKAPRFISPPATNVTCRITDHPRKGATIDCVDQEAHQFAVVSTSDRSGRVSGVTYDQVTSRQFEPAAQSATLGLDETFTITDDGAPAITCQATARTIDCRNEAGHGFNIGGDVPLYS